MDCRAEINRFAIFLFCLLVPLGSMAPTETSESKVTTDQALKHFTTEIPTYASVILQEARKLFKFYNECISSSFHSDPLKINSKAKNVADRMIPECLAFHANCCALHKIQKILETQRKDIETMCKDDPEEVIQGNLNQLNTILSQGTIFYTCSSHTPTQGQPTLGRADTKTYIWLVLKKYKDIMQLTANLYSGAAV